MKIDNILLKNFTELTLEEHRMLLSWRNSDRVRMNMYTSYIIEEESHLKFIDILKESIDKKYFLVYEYDEPIGVVYFTNIDRELKSTEFGLYTNPNKKGNGNKLMNVIKKYAFILLNLNMLRAEVFEFNKKAIKLYEKFNFKVIDTKLVNYNRVIVMNLESENN
jgi:UDP-4-amino-4,6-dideoxy-N-acetyl-beta-L-altrosamine N-acetyltransferase